MIPHPRRPDARRPDPDSAEHAATWLIYQFTREMANHGLTYLQVGQVAGVHPKTVGLLDRIKIHHFPNLVTFVRLLAAVGLELRIVRTAPPPPPDPRRNASTWTSSRSSSAAPVTGSPSPATTAPADDPPTTSS